MKLRKFYIFFWTKYLHIFKIEFPAPPASKFGKKNIKFFFHIIVLIKFKYFLQLILKSNLCNLS